MSRTPYKLNKQGPYLIQRILKNRIYDFCYLCNVINLNDCENNIKAISIIS
jgi:hypothetical protein